MPPTFPYHRGPPSRHYICIPKRDRIKNANLPFACFAIQWIHYLSNFSIRLVCVLVPQLFALEAFFLSSFHVSCLSRISKRPFQPLSRFFLLYRDAMKKKLFIHFSVGKQSMLFVPTVLSLGKEKKVHHKFEKQNKTEGKQFLTPRRIAN